jgi:hypothetical protein
VLLKHLGTNFLNYLKKDSLKYRTAYPISLFAQKLKLILRERNKYCNDRPFLSPILIESGQTEGNASHWVSSEVIAEARWNVENKNLVVRNPLEVDFHNYCFTWRSDCKRVEFKLHFNKKIAWVRYPVRIPAATNDEYEQKMENSKLKSQKSDSHLSKYLYKYTYNEQEFSTNHLPGAWQELFARMSRLVEKVNDVCRNLDEIKAEVLENEQTKTCIVVRLPEAMSLSCHLTHLHKFDSVETVSEPKIIYLNHTWHKFDYTFLFGWSFCIEKTKLYLKLI